MSRLSSYLESKQGRAARIIIVLLVVVILMASTLLYYALDLGNPFQAPYPSEETPLTLTSTGVVWTMKENLSIGGDCRYANIYFTWGTQTSRIGGSLVNDSEQEVLDSGIPTSIESWHATYGGSVDAFDICTNISESSGDGNFRFGDSIAFEARPAPNWYVQEDETMTVALVYIGNGFVLGLGEYGYAVHEGKFYSWRSASLDWSRPWYDIFLPD